MKQQIIWTLERAKEDYKKTQPKKLEKKSCKHCQFGSEDMEDDVYCNVKEKYIFFTKRTAGKCKYFNSKYPYKKYKK